MQDQLSRLVRTVPRYTSYPTAPHFTPEVGPVTAGEWLGTLGSAQRLSLYLHIPFCRTLCWYCGCQTRQVRRYDPVPPYLAALSTEMEMVSGLMHARSQVSHIHFGGGTPTILHPEDVRRLMGHLRDSFLVKDDAEIAVEIDPRGLNGAKLAAWMEGGLNRASLGVQDINPRVQKAINRIQPPELTRRVIDDLRDAGIQSISVDLIYGLPHQTVEDVERTVEEVVRCGVDRVSVFGYAHVPWMRTHQQMIDETVLPGPMERLNQSNAAADLLEASGFARIGMDHFARRRDTMAKALAQGQLKRNFQGYTTDAADALIGLGASAIGRLPQGYLQNEPATGRYLAAIGEGRLATARGYHLTDDDRVRGHVIERLLCDFGFDADDLRGRFGELAEPILEEATALADEEPEEGLMRHGDWFEVEESARPFVRTVAARFDAHLTKGAARHSAAV